VCIPQATGDGVLCCAAAGHNNTSGSAVANIDSPSPTFRNYQYHYHCFYQQQQQQHGKRLLLYHHQQQHWLQQQQHWLQQQQLGYSFSDPGLLSQALTHVSQFGVISYQRLEFLGDAVLDLMVSLWLMQQVADHIDGPAAPDAPRRSGMRLAGTSIVAWFSEMHGSVSFVVS
jgi:hypothetical protein